jgi:hypothetical protein
MTSPAAAAEEGQSRCWCCGRALPEAELVPLGAHPEAAVCLRCARDLVRRARELQDQGGQSLGARARSLLNEGRSVVVRHGWHNLPVVGPALRWLGDHIP